MSIFRNITKLTVAFTLAVSVTGCCSTGCWTGFQGPLARPTCQTGVCESGTCGTDCQSSCGACGQRGILRCGGFGCGRGSRFWSDLDFALFGWAWRKSNAIPETPPLGSTVRAHDQVMQTNAEAVDFIINQHDFIGQTAQLTPDGRDKVLEIAARMRSAPFPVIVERTWNNADPELDTVRRNLVAQVLTDLGNVDAQQRTVVATPYGPGYTATRSEQLYYQHVLSSGNNNNNNNGNNNGGGFGGGGFGGGGGF
ncbi:MAG: hypothetical protein KDA66_06400 [Planctomycetaceae bacterium]|nr:hypothetical protein [Planctomycetaceae bacterium]